MQNIALTLLEKEKKNMCRVFQMKGLLCHFLCSTDFKIKLIIIFNSCRVQYGSSVE